MKYLLITLLAVFGVASLAQTVTALNAQDKVPESVTETFNPSANEGEFHKAKVSVPTISAEHVDVLGKKASSKKKSIKIDLSKQKLYAYEGSKRVMSFLVSTGKWGRTPTGSFKIWTKLSSTLMTGGSKALGTYYYLPNVPYTMYFYNSEVPKTKGYGIHGAYWHNNFGHPMSHGCVNMKPEEAGKLFNWADLDTPIEIFGTAPKT